MKKFDGFSIRGIVFLALGLAGIGYETIFSKPGELLIIVLYGVVVVIGLWLIFFKEDEEH